LALRIVHHARQLGLRFDWVGMDGLYGQSLELLQTLEDQGETFAPTFIRIDTFIGRIRLQPYRHRYPVLADRACDLTAKQGRSWYANG
jgi:hypothetical protein